MTRLFSRYGAAALAALLSWAAVVPVYGDALPEDENDADALAVTADFNHDGIADMAQAVAVEDGGILRVLIGQKSSGLRVAFGISLARRAQAVAVGDFNQDGLPDIIVGEADGSVQLFSGDGSGGLISGGEVAHLDSIVSIAVGDFNHDGILDIAASDWRSSTVTVLLGLGRGTFSHGWSFPLRMRGTAPQISVADYNGDGIPDLAIVYGDDGAYTFDVMLGNGNGAFTAAPALGTAIDANAHCPT